MPRLSKSRRTLDALVEAAGFRSDVVGVESLAIGWPGKGGYRDDDGTHARAHLGQHGSVIFREYGTTLAMPARFRVKEAAVFEHLAAAGLPVPSILAATDGIADFAGPPAMLLSDAGGEPLEELDRRGAFSDPALWRAVGAALRQLHDVPLTGREPFAHRDFARAWMDFAPYFGRTIAQLRKRHPALDSPFRELNRLLREQVADHLATRPRTICCGHIGGFPGLMLEPDEGGWATVGWLGLGYYVSIGDPDRDVVAIAARHQLRTGRDIPGAFYTGYGRRPDHVAAVVYDAYQRLRVHPDQVADVVERLRVVLP
ncbi:MAG TPA: phosphotransferase [Acidimicrobiales bacterium]